MQCECERTLVWIAHLINKPYGARRKRSGALDSCFGLVSPHQLVSASSCVFLPLYAISSSSVRSSRASVVTSLWRSLPLPSLEPVMMGPQHLHRQLLPSRYFLLCHIMCRRPTTYTRCCSLYCASRCAPCQHSNNCATYTSYTVITAIAGSRVRRHIRVSLVPRPLFRFYVGSGY